MTGNGSPVEQFDFQFDFQQKVLAVILRDPELLLQYRHMFRAAYFSDSALRQLAEWALYYFDTYSMKPTQPAMRQMVQAYCAASPVHQPHVETYLAWVDVLYAMDITDSNFVKAQLHEFVEQREFMLAVKAAIPKLNDPKLRKEIVDDILKAQANLAQTHGSIGVSGVGMDATQRTAYLFEEEIRDCIPSLWPNFNLHCGGYALGEMTVFAGSPNRGKSWALVHAAVSAIVAGKKVVFYSCEMSEKLILLRVYSILTGMTVEELKMNPQLLENKIQEYRALGGEIIVKQFQNAELRHVREHLMGVEANLGWRPDMVVVDYADLLTTADIEVDRHVLRNIYKGLRDLAVQYHFAMVTASQLNRGADKKEKPTIADLAECYEKAAIADVIWMLCQTDEEIQMARMRLYNAKNRNMERGKVVPLALQLSRGQLIDEAPVTGPPVTPTQAGALPTSFGTFGGPTGPPPQEPPPLPPNPFSGAHT